MFIMLFIYLSFMYSILTFTFILFFFNDTATTEIYTLSLHDALPICREGELVLREEMGDACDVENSRALADTRDRKSTRLNSSHITISYAVFCLKKKKKNNRNKDISKKNDSRSRRYH